MANIKIEHDGAKYTFGTRTNALNIILYLAYYEKGNSTYSFTDAWSRLKRDDIQIPKEVERQARMKAAELTTIQ